MKTTHWIACVGLAMFLIACDSGGSTGTATEAQEPLAITTDTLPNGEINAAYVASLEATGGAESGYTFSVQSGTLPQGLALNGNEISGSPDVGGNFNFIVAVTDADMNSAQRALSIRVESAAPLTITTTALPDGEIHNAYHAVIDAQDGALTGYQWSVIAGSLPPGVIMTGGTPTDSQAEVAGVPTAPGTFNFTVRIADALGDFADRALQVFVDVPPLEMVTTTLPDAFGGVAYSESIAANGGNGTGYIWSVTAGALPNGLTLTDGTPAATLSGTPLQSGLFTFTLQVQDSWMNSDSRQFDLSITPPGPLAVSTTTLPDAGIGVDYDQPLQATGGYPPYTWSLVSGGMPQGMYLYIDRVVGIPMDFFPGAFTFEVRVDDAIGGFVVQSLSITTLSAGMQINTSATLHYGVVGDDYLEIFGATGGSFPYTGWQVVGGALPPGLTLGAVTQDGATVNGVLRGTPTTAGVFNFTISVDDATQSTVQKAFELTVYAVSGPLTIRTTPKYQLALTMDANIPLEVSGGSGAGYTWSSP
jgi:large repetitive protein